MRRRDERARGRTCSWRWPRRDPGRVPASRARARSLPRVRRDLRARLGARLRLPLAGISAGGLRPPDGGGPARGAALERAAERGMRKRTAAVVRVELTRPLETIQPRGHEQVLLVVSVAGRVVGQVFVDARAALEPEAQWRAIEAELGDEALGAFVGRRVSQVAGTAATADSPPVSVIVCTRDRPEALDACLASIRRLRTQPAELVVVDNSGGDREV